jgi:hypothetical protein
MKVATLPPDLRTTIRNQGERQHDKLVRYYGIRTGDVSYVC